MEHLLGSLRSLGAAAGASVPETEAGLPRSGSRTPHRWRSRPGASGALGGTVNLGRSEVPATVAADILVNGVPRACLGLRPGHRPDDHGRRRAERLRPRARPFVDHARRCVTATTSPPRSKSARTSITSPASWPSPGAKPDHAVPRQSHRQTKDPYPEPQRPRKEARCQDEPAMHKERPTGWTSNHRYRGREVLLRRTVRLAVQRPAGCPRVHVLDGRQGRRGRGRAVSAAARHGAQGVPPFWSTYIAVDDVDALPRARAGCWRAGPDAADRCHGGGTDVLCDRPDRCRSRPLAGRAAHRRDS